MLLNDIGYNIYYAGGSHQRPLRKRRSWPRVTAVSSMPAAAAAGPRRIVGRALIGLGQLIAAEPSMAPAGR